VAAVGYGAAYSFKYSPRPGTPAAERAMVDPAEADDRLQRLQALVTAQQHATQTAMIGRVVRVLFEKPGRMPGQITGKSEYLHAVHADGPLGLVGQIAPVEIIASQNNSLTGRLIG
jgi:tRNA-2-methylthio-N6-dimethylallyladenosine synthase